MLEYSALVCAGILPITLLLLIGTRTRHLRIQKILVRQDAGTLLPHTREWELYHNELAPSQRIRACLSELNIAYKSHKIETDANPRSIILKEILRGQPKQQIPMLLHNGRAVYDSRIQMDYLIKQQGQDGQMVPKGDEEKSKLASWLSKKSGIDEEDFRLIKGNEIFTVSLPLVGAVLEQKSITELIKVFLYNRFSRRPMTSTVVRKLKLVSILESTVLADAFESAKEALETELDEAEHSLKEHGEAWLTGETFTQIDIELMILLDRLDLVTILEDLFDAHRPNLRSYWQRLKSRKSYKAAILKHRRSDVANARKKILEERANNSDFDELLRVNH